VINDPSHDVSVLGHHTDDNLRRHLDDTTAAFNIADKVVRIVTDNASNNLKAFDLLIMPRFEAYFEPEDDEDEEAEEEDDDDDGTEQCEEQDGKTFTNDRNERVRVPCFSQALQLTVGDGLKECGSAKSALAKVAAIAKLT
jgi:hypothetical protein